MEMRRNAKKNETNIDLILILLKYGGRKREIKWFFLMCASYMRVCVCSACVYSKASCVSMTKNCIIKITLIQTPNIFSSRVFSTSVFLFCSKEHFLFSSFSLNTQQQAMGCNNSWFTCIFCFGRQSNYFELTKLEMMVLYY